MMNQIVAAVVTLGVSAFYIYYQIKIGRSDRAAITLHDINQIVINNLIEAGSNPHKEHNIEFAFYGDQNNLQKLGSYLTQRGYYRMYSDSVNMCVLGKKLKLQIHEICAETHLLSSLARTYHVQYDGWGSNIVK